MNCFAFVGNAGPSQMGVLLVLVVIGCLISAAKRFFGNAALMMARNALVVTHFKVEKGGTVYVDIQGRKAGVLAWLLSLIGVDPRTTLRVTENRVEFSEGSLSGRVMHTIPLSTVCNLGAGYSKPFVLLVVGILMLLLAIIALAADDIPAGAAFFNFVVSGLCILFYYLKKTLTLFFIPPSGVGVCVGFKRSVIEGVNIDERQAFDIIGIVTELIEKNTRHESLTVGARKNVKCPSCGEDLELPHGVAKGQSIRCPYCNMKFQF